MSSSDSNADSTIISNSEGFQYVETDQWDFEETTGDKFSNANTLGGIVQPYHLEPHASDSAEKGGSVSEE